MRTTKRDVAFSAALAAMLVATLGIKAAASDYGVGGDSTAMTRDIAAALRAHGFATRLERHRFQSDVVDAVRGSCRVRARDAARAGDFEDLFADQSRWLGPTRYMFRGDVFDKPPLLRAKLAETAAMAWARLGFAAGYRPLVAVAQRGCGRDVVDLSSVRLHVRR